GGEAMSVDRSYDFLAQQFRSWVTVELSADDDMNGPCGGGQMKSQVAEKLACGGMIREKNPLRKMIRFICDTQRLIPRSAAIARRPAQRRAMGIIERTVRRNRHLQGFLSVFRPT